MMYTQLSIKKVLQAKGYDFFKSGPYDLNIIGIRSNESRSNSFDDVMAVIYNDEYYQPQLKLYPITTDPGKPYLLNPLKGTGGTAVLVPGQYRAAYKIGIHGRSHRGGGYKALEQISKMAYVRDNNRDSIIDFKLYLDPRNIRWENPKTNIHHASRNFISRWVEVHSAGCQVFQKYSDFVEFMNLCQKQVSHKMGDTFTYTLLEQRDFPG